MIRSNPRRAGSEVPRMNTFVAISADDRKIFDLLVAQPLVGQLMHMQVEQWIRADTRRTTLTSVVTELFSLRLQYNLTKRGLMHRSAAAPAKNSATLTPFSSLIRISPAKVNSGRCWTAKRRGVLALLFR
jgi:hypothetical protein